MEKPMPRKASKTRAALEEENAALKDALADARALLWVARKEHRAYLEDDVGAVREQYAAELEQDAPARRTELDGGTDGPR